MAKHNQLIDTIDENITNGVKNGILHLTSNATELDGKTIYIAGKKYTNFSSYSYLGLGIHQKLVEGSIEATKKYGVHSDASRAYVSIDLYDELEDKLGQIFDADVLVAPSTTLAHQAALPVLIRDEDVILLDQQVHASIQTTVKMIRDRGVPVELIRHNRIDLIEDRIKELKKKHRRIWYMPDGVYSMYGDYAPLTALQTLMNKYEQFHLYVDDAHGMSWTGVKGVGYSLSQIDLHDQMVLVTSLNKAFASAGGALILPKEEWKRKIRTCGGPLIFSTSMQPPMLGAAVASAKLHLSDELKQLQHQFKKVVTHCSEKLAQTNLLEVSENDSPIFYVGTSYPKVSYNLVRRMMREGFYVNPALFPAVSMRRSGIRFCMNVNHTVSDINNLVDALDYHYLKALDEESVGVDKVYRSFGVEFNQEIKHSNPEKIEKNNRELTIKKYSSIKKIDPKVWNDLLGDKGTFDWNGLSMLEETFKENPKKENNWDFFYFLVNDHQGVPILATFFTRCWCKDDIFKPGEISHTIEQKRHDDPYYLCTNSLMMGSLLTEGQHLYLNKTSIYWREAFLLLFNEVNDLQLEHETNAVYLRDFEKNDQELLDLFIANGYVQVELPDYAHEMTGLNWKNTDEYLESLSSSKRQRLKRYVLRYENKYNIEVKESVNADELKHLYQLYLNVKNKSVAVNTFDVPFKAFESMNEDANWEIITLSLKENEYLKSDPNKGKAIAVSFSFKSEFNYVPLLFGINYKYLFTHKNYKQLIYQTVKRANILGVKKIYLGLTATTEKTRLGCEAIEKVAFVQLADTFNMELMEMEKGSLITESAR